MALSTRYPTEKAYGVTTTETAKALRDAGNRVQIVAPRNLGAGVQITDSNESIRVVEVSVPAQEWLWKRYGSGVPWAANSSFLVFRILFALTLRKHTKHSDLQALWVRDPLIALLAKGSMNKRRILLEIHRRPKWIDAWLIRILSRRHTQVLAFLTPQLEELLYPANTNARKVILPVGVSEDFFGPLTDSFQAFASPRVIITYVGKGRSSGNDNNLEILIEAALLAEKRNLPYIFKLVGLESETIDYLREYSAKEGVSETFVTISGHIKHSKVTGELLTSDILVIPYLDSEYYKDAFSIKLLEYAASGRPILASDTKAHRQVLGEDRASFFDPNDAISLLEIISKMQRIPEETHRKTVNAQNWARGYTYSTRASIGITALQSVGNASHNEAQRHG